MLEGCGRFGAADTPATAGQVIWLGTAGADTCTELKVAADTAMRALFWAGPPLGEPVVARGPFVMNTHGQIAEAYADYRAGKF